MGEYFDVPLPYAEAVSDYPLKNADKVTMPRKLKVGFSNSPVNVTHATFRDLGFVATEDGTFTVYSAGGLGNNPRMGVKVAENVEPSQILYYVHSDGQYLPGIRKLRRTAEKPEHVICRKNWEAKAM